MTRSLRMHQTAEKYVSRSQFSSIEWQVAAGGAVISEGTVGFAASTYFWVDPSEKMVGVIMTQYLGSILPMSEEMRASAYQMLGA